MANVDVRGDFVWHDLLTPNRAGAQEFYGQAVGWKSQPWENDASYTLFVAKRGPVGGVMEDRAATPHWLPYISTSSVDETAEAAARLGARVQTPPTDLPNGGRYAMLFDPQGAPFGIHASADDDGRDPGTPGPGEFSWHELATNVAPSIAFGFYAALFDWDEMSQYDMGPMGIYLSFGRKGRQLGGMYDKGAAGKPGSAYWLGYVNVNDLDGAVERAKAARGSVLVGPMEVPGGDRIAQIMDPHGAFFALHLRAGQTSAKAGGETAAAARPAKPAAKKKAPARKAAASKRTAKKKPAKAAARKKAKAKPAAKKKAAAKRAKPVKAKPKAKGKKTKKRGR